MSKHFSILHHLEENFFPDEVLSAKVRVYKKIRPDARIAICNASTHRNEYHECDA